jgi:hypothetical protein
MRPLILLLFIISFHSLKGQDTIKVKPKGVTIQAIKFSEWPMWLPYKPDMLYIGIENHIKITVPDKYKGYTVTVINGTLSPTEIEGRYIAKISYNEPSTIKVLFKGKEVGSKEFIVMRLPSTR